MYLTRIQLNQRDRDLIVHYTDSDYWHKNVMSGFQHTGYEGYDKRNKYKVLFRLIGRSLYISSLVRPVYNQSGWIRTVETKDISGVVDSFEVGNTYSFDICVVPYTKVDGKTQLLKSDADKEEWFHEAQKYGFELQECYLDSFGETVLEHVGGNDYNIKATRFIGRLKVTDKEQFQKLYRTGLGREKAYGAGMLLLSR